MIKRVLQFKDETDRNILMTKSCQVDVDRLKSGEYEELIQDLKDTLHNSKTGCGISAVQIGCLVNICIIHYNAQDITLINPIITRQRGEIDSVEGCLSAPNEVFGTFKRAQKVWVDYIDEKGNRKEIEGSGLFSRCLQHELEHFNGWCKVFEKINIEEVEE